MKALRYNPITHALEDEVEVNSLIPIDGMWYSTNRGLEPIAYLYDPKHKETLDVLLDQYRRKLAEMREYETHLFYKVLPNYRIKGE